MQKLDKDKESKMVGVVLTTDQIDWLKSKGKASTVVRELVDREIKKDLE